jgi:hypothetical protein
MNDEEKYEVNDILNSRYHYEKLQYKVVWSDHFSDRAWYSAENFEHFKNILKNYHQRYSEKFESELRLMIIIDAMLSKWIRNEHKKAKQLIQNVLNKIKAKIKENDRMRSKKIRLLIFSIDTKKRKYVRIQLKNSDSLKFELKIFNQNEIFI